MRYMNLLLILMPCVLIQYGMCSEDFSSDFGIEKELVHKGLVAVGLGKTRSYDETPVRPTMQVMTVEQYIKPTENLVTEYGPTYENTKPEYNFMIVPSRCPSGTIRLRSGTCMEVAQYGGSL